MNINPIDFNYIDGKNTYPIVEYIDDNIGITSNILNNKIDYTSNILNNKITYVNNILYNVNKLIDEKTEDILLPIPATLTHTYIYNSNLAGEIRFFTASTASFPIIIPSGIPSYRTKIDLDGKLKIYYTYDPAINLTYGNGWVDIVNSIVALNASDVNFGITIGGLQAEVGYNFTFLENQINALLSALGEEGILTLHEEDIFSTLDIQNIRDAMQTTRDLELSGQNLSTVYANIKAFLRTGQFRFLTEASSIFSRLISNNAAVAFYLGVGGLAFAAVINALSTDRYAQTVLSQIKNNITSNVNLSSNLKIELLSSNREEFINTYINYASNLYDISYYQGFLNSNTLSAQLIPNLSTSNINLIKGNISNVNNINCTSITTNQINLNSKVITTLALKDIDNFIQTQYGTYFDITNGTLAINSTPTTTDFFRVGGQTTIQGDIIGETKIKITNINQAFPSVGINGGNGDRLILKEGTASTYPVSFGFSGLDLWYSVPTAVSHRFYVNGSLISSIFSAGLSTTGYINASTNLRENGVNLSSKYLQLSGGSMTGNLSSTGTINASTNLQENGVNLTSKYLQLSGGSMTGQITGVTTLNGTTGIFGTLQTTNNTNVAVPSVGIAGGIGDKLILYSGSVSTYPYSFGINTNELWYSTPTGASHKFYVNGSAITTISSTGLSTTGTINASTNLQENGTNLTSKYLQLSGGSMTGQITGVTTLNGTTGIFGKLQTTNNTNVAAPSLGVAGGIGDKIILYPGSVSTYPYSFGINTNELWYSTPSGASHKFYNNGTNILTLNSSGDITTPGSINITSANQFLTFGQRLQDNLIKLWTDGNFTFGLGINSSVLRYNVPAGSSHIFYTGTNNTLQINPDGHLISPGYIYAGGTTSGLRINGNDYGNTIYQNATTIGGQPANIGFTLRDANSFNFQSFSSAGLYTTIARFNTTNGLSLFGNMTGGNNVCKRSIFTFTPTGVIIGAFGFRYAQDIQLTNYISTLTGPIGNMYIFRIHIWTTSGDFGDSSANVENMTYLVYLADFGGNPKIRIHTIVNNSNGSLIAVQSSTSIYYNGWNGAGGASQKYCVIENISGY